MWPFKRKPVNPDIQQHVDEAEHEHRSSDLTRRRRLLDEVQRQLAQATAPPIVALDDFFIGNEDFGSIGCNLDPVPGPRKFYETLQAIRARADVQDVLIEISDLNENDPDPSMWPFSDQLYVLTRATREDVEAWLAPLQPDEVDTDLNPRVQAIDLKSGMKAYRAWWD